MNPAGRITVLLAEDHTVVREGLRLLLETEGDIQIVGEAENGREAVALTQKLRPSVVVMDIAMPKLNGLEATRQILEMAPATRVLILSAHGDNAYVERITQLGAAGYVLKLSSAHILAQAVREVYRGRTFFSPTIVRSLALRSGGAAPRLERPGQKKFRLTSRETEVLQLIAEGQANKQVAAELGISVKTVEKHRQRLMGKLGIHDTASLTRFAIASGLVESSVQLTII